MDRALRKKVHEIREVTGCNEKQAKRLLEVGGASVEQAVDYFFAHPEEMSARQSHAPAGDRTSIIRIFDSFVDPDDPEALFDQGLRDYLSTIGVDPDKVDALVLFRELNAADVGEIKRHEFVEGWQRLGGDSILKMKQHADKCKASLEDKEYFKDFYRWLFNYLKENKKKRTISKALGLSIWGLVLDPVRFPLVKKYSTFLGEKEVEVFTRDLWEQSFEFLQETKSDLSNFDQEGAWPVLIDEFYENCQ